MKLIHIVFKYSDNGIEEIKGCFEDITKADAYLKQLREADKKSYPFTQHYDMDSFELK